MADRQSRGDGPDRGAAVHFARHEGIRQPVFPVEDADAPHRAHLHLRHPQARRIRARGTVRRRHR